MFSKFFIDRPVFSWVISIIIVIAGLATYFTLPVTQYPEITPPTVAVSAVYPGANAQVISETVAAPIEQQVNGVENMLYMSSTSSSDGSYALTVSFEVGTDLDTAQVLVQNRVNLALSQLPEEVTRQGVSTKKKSTAIILIASLFSEDERFDSLFLSNYATLNLRDELSRIDGVGEVQIFPSSDYSMRVWLDPERVAARNLSVGDILAAIREQNAQVAAGQIGQPPTEAGQDYQLVVNVQGRLSSVEQFGDIVLKTAGDGATTRLSDVARIELGAQNYDINSSLNGKTSASIAIYQLPGANAIEVSERVRAKLDELAERFPQGLEYRVPYDTTIFVAKSIEEVYVTLFQAGALVFLVLFLFLQDWRATVIPAITIPVSLIGTFAVMAMFGFSLNTLTLFGLVLAIGVVVDDSIVVVEATAKKIEEGMASRDAAIAAMVEVTGPVIATTLVLLAVFVPAAFLPGITGQMYQQFALTIAIATVFSSINALTMSPMLAAALLRPQKGQKNLFFRGFDALFSRLETGYAAVVGAILRRATLAMVLFAGLLGLTGWQFTQLPSGFLPTEDQGYVLASVQLPDAASLERTSGVVRQIDGILAETPGIVDWVALGGFSMIDGTRASNAATLFILMDDHENRTDPGLSMQAILQRLQRQFFAIQEAVVFAFPPPAITGLGVASGFQMQLQDRADAGLDQLQQFANEIIQSGNGQTGLTNLNTTFRAGVPQLYAELDRAKAKEMGVSLNEIFGTLQTYLGSAYVNDFNLFGRVWQVKLQAEQDFRREAEDIRALKVRNSAGDMVPLGALISVDTVIGPQSIQRYNLYPSASITGQAAPGFSSGEALRMMEQLSASVLPPSLGFEWTGMSYQERQVGNEQLVIFALALVLVFLVLAAQYESWTSPAAVIMVVPLALLGVVGALLARGFDNNVYTQIGIVLLIGLATKNAILIVEFAIQSRAEGMGLMDAAKNAARLRFRPILMTAISSIAGFMPLVIASGAGAASRQALGTAVVGGMIAATVMSLLLTPVFYRIMAAMSREKPAGKGDAENVSEPPEGAVAP